MLALLACCWALAAEPSDHTLVYYNARMALREGAPLEATRLWLLRNALEDQTGRVSTHDADFGSVTWSRHASSAFSTSLYFSSAAVALPRSQPSLTRCSTSETKFVTCAGAGLADCCWRLGFALPDGEACWTRL